jgi:hypothetical protein
MPKRFGPPTLARGTVRFRHPAILGVGAGLSDLVRVHSALQSSLVNPGSFISEWQNAALQRKKFDMALYRYRQYLAHNTEATFDAVFKPGTKTPYSGIYRCLGCGREVVSEQEKPLPSQNHHQHTIAQGSIRWRMIVYADHRPK